MESRPIHLGVSGGGFAIPGLAGATLELLESGIKPDIISGVSSGAIISFVVAGSSNPIKAIKENIIGFKTTDVFSRPPFTKKGGISISAIFSAIFNNYLSKQDRLKDLLKSIVSIEEWEQYRTREGSMDCFSMSVDFVTGSRNFVNLKNYNYEDALELVLASSSIPVFVKPVYMDGKVLVDGGVRNHILTEWIMDNYKLEKSYSIFSRAKDFKKIVKKEKLKSIVQMLFRTIDIFENEISKSDEQLADLKADKLGIEHYNFYIKNILDNVYEDDLDKQKELFEYGKQQVKSYLKEKGGV